MHRLPNRMRTVDIRACVGPKGMVMGKDRRGVCSAEMLSIYGYTPPVVL